MNYFQRHFLYPQLLIKAADNAVKPKSVTATVTIQRNEHAPVFSSSQYNESISENWSLNLEILKVEATDADSTIELNKNVSKLSTI